MRIAKQPSILMLIFLLASLSYRSAFAQAPDTAWIRTFGTLERNEFGRSIQQTSNNSFVLTGTYFSTLAFMALDSLGNVLWDWSQYYGGIGYSLDLTHDGNYAIGALMGGFGMIKLDSSGIIQAGAYFGDTTGACRSICETADLGYIGVGSVGIPGPYPCQFYILKLYPDWEPEWEVACGELWQSEVGYSIKQGIDGSYIAVGVTGGLGDSRIYAVRISQFGDTLWTRTYDPANSDQWAWSVELAPDSGYLIVGYRGWGTDDVYCVRINQHGDTLWTRTYGNPTNDEVGYDIATTSDGGYIIVGYTMSIATGDKDIYLLKIDSDGNMLWDTTYVGGPYEDEGYSVQQTTDYGYIITGQITVDYGGGYESADICVIKTLPDLGIEEHESTSINKDKMTTTIVSGSLLLPEGNKCKVFDITGRVVEPTSITRGIYFVEVDGVVAQKVVKVR